MLPGRDALEEIARREQGTLEEVPYAVLLAALALAKRSCVAALTHRRTEKRIVFLSGVPVECRSNLVHETFGRFLVSQGKITEDQFALAFAQSQARGALLGEVLVEQGALPRDEVVRTLQQNLARKLLDGFGWREGTFSLLADPPPISAPLKVNVAQLIVTGVAKFAPQAAVDAAAGALVGKRLALAPEPPFPLEEIRLSEGQARLAAALARRPRIDELATEVSLPFEEITRLLYALFLLGTVVPADQTRGAVSPPRPAAPPAPAASASATAPASPGGPAAPAPVTARAAAGGSPAPPLDAAALHLEHEGHRGRDPFDLLQVGADAAEAEIVAAFLKRSEEWAPWRYPDGEAREKATALFTAAARAYARLSDAEARETLRKARRPAATAPAAAPANVFAIKTDLLDSEAQHRKGAELLAAGKLKQALPYLEFAADCDPQNGSYAADLAWCRYVAAGRMTSASTLAELDEAIRIDPKSGIACFYAGEILREKGDAVRAEPYYRKAARLMAPDRRPLDALREMSRSLPR